MPLTLLAAVVLGAIAVLAVVIVLEMRGDKRRRSGPVPSRRRRLRRRATSRGSGPGRPAPARAGTARPQAADVAGEASGSLAPDDVFASPDLQDLEARLAAVSAEHDQSVVQNVLARLVAVEARLDSVERTPTGLSLRFTDDTVLTLVRPGLLAPPLLLQATQSGMPIALVGVGRQSGGRPVLVFSVGTQRIPVTCRALRLAR